MKLKLCILSSLVLAPQAFAAPAEADDIRCTRDSLNINQSLDRVNWAVDVQKETKRRTTTGNLRNERYDNKEELINYWSDEGETSLAGRPIYPTHMIPIGNSGWDLANSTWRAFPIASRSATVPSGYIHAAYCTSSCFYPGMKVLFDNGYADIKFAHDLNAAGRNAKLQKLIVLDKSSTLNKPKYTAAEIGAFTTELTEEEIEIFSLIMQDKTVLRVTGNHIFINAEGKAVTAEDLSKEVEQGNTTSILDMKGKPVQVGQITKAVKLTKVYNVRPASREVLNNILVVDGYLTGSSYLQNVDLKEANDHLFVNSMAARPEVTGFLNDLNKGE
jgi:hypothetical protein